MVPKYYDNFYSYLKHFRKEDSPRGDFSSDTLDILGSSSCKICVEDTYDWKRKEWITFLYSQGSSEEIQLLFRELWKRYNLKGKLTMFEKRMRKNQKFKEKRIL